MTQTYSHDGTATTSLSLFALGSSSYLDGKKNIYSFEAADSSTATTPAIFLAPMKNKVSRLRLRHGEGLCGVWGR